jgi:hypothetical protein
MDTTEQNKNIVTSFIQTLFTKGDLGAVDEYLAEDFVDHDPPGRDQHLAGPRRPYHRTLGAPRRPRPDAPARPGPGILTTRRYDQAHSPAYRRFMSDAIMKRQVTALIGRCYAGLDAASLRDEVLRRLRRIMTVDAAFFGTVDPQTLLFTSAVAEEPLEAATPLFLDNEYGRADVNKFAALAEAADPVSVGTAGPGMVVLDQDLTVMSLNAEAAQWLAEIDEADWPASSELPAAVYAAAARLARLEAGAPLPLSASVRLRGRSGQ